MAQPTPLFTVPIAPTGNITCIQPSPKVYLLTFTSPPDNRLTPSFDDAFLLALDIVEHKLPKGVVVTTSGIAKFYSNGLDLPLAQRTKGFMKNHMYPLWRRLITYPMPTVALINGHAFAGGFITAMMHDYRIMNPHKGFLCMNEIEFGVPLRPPMSSIFRQKLTRPETYRLMVLEAKRFNALESLKEGMVDGLGGWDETLKFIGEMKLVGKGESGVYGELKKEMWRETISYLEDGEEETKLRNQAQLQLQRDEENRNKVDGYERALVSGKPKL